MMRYCLIAAAGALLAGCLPSDTRRPPGSIYLTAEPGAAITSGVSTSDGWQIAFERLLVGLGGVYLENNACNSYADADYERVFDFVAAKGPQKLSEVYGLGPCTVRIGIGAPGVNAVLGAGVTAADLAFMRTPGTDMWGPGGNDGVDAGQRPRRASVFVQGRASKGGQTKRFSWIFRRRYWAINCPAAGAGGAGAEHLNDVTLHSGDALKFRVVMHGEELFRERAADDAALRFDALADADTNGDQTITLDELANAPGPPPDMDAGLSTDGGTSSLGDFIYLLLVPRMLHLADSGACLPDIITGPSGR